MNINIIIYIVIGVLALLSLLLILLKIKKDGLRQTIINLIVEAEDNFIKGKNDEKFNYVFDNLYNILPSKFKFFISKDCIEKLIQEVFEEIKIALDHK